MNCCSPWATVRAVKGQPITLPTRNTHAATVLARLGFTLVVPASGGPAVQQDPNPVQHKDNPGNKQDDVKRIRCRDEPIHQQRNDTRE